VTWFEDGHIGARRQAEIQITDEDDVVVLRIARGDRLIEVMISPATAAGIASDLRNHAEKARKRKP
jgi:hypothetical protein